MNNQTKNQKLNPVSLLREPACDALIYKCSVSKKQLFKVLICAPE